MLEMGQIYVLRVILSLWFTYTGQAGAEIQNFISPNAITDRYISEATKSFLGVCNFEKVDVSIGHLILGN